MKKLILLSCLALAFAGCGPTKSKEQVEIDQAKNEPILICERDGVKVYKIKDDTPGGTHYVYFTVPAGDTFWKSKEGKSETQRQTVGVAGAK